MLRSLNICHSSSQNEERSIVIQIRLLMLLNEHLWLALDTNDYSTAAQYYLLARHIHTGKMYLPFYFSLVFKITCCRFELSEKRIYRKTTNLVKNHRYNRVFKMQDIKKRQKKIAGSYIKCTGRYLL